MRLIEYFLQESAEPLNPDIVLGLLDGDEKIAQTKLSRWPWEDWKRPTGSSTGKYWDKGQQKFPSAEDDVIFTAHIFILPSSDFSALSNRGSSNAGGWMVDVEITLIPTDGMPGVMILHSEKRYPDEQTAQAVAEKLKQFIDSHSMLDLAKIPRSGENEMSKSPI